MGKKKTLMDILNKTLGMLKEKLPSDLYYHNYEHTLDVLGATERIAIAENATEDEILLLKIAAAFHDTGYIYSRENHEQRSCAIAREIITGEGISDEIADRVCELILATKVPHNPKDKLSEILCDADLDYLGRDDYFTVSEKVFKEFKLFGIVSDEREWKDMQVKFLESHRYFTKTSNDLRKKKKEEHLRKIKESK